MELTAHGIERIHGRTRMFTKDVLAIISEGSFISIGNWEEQEYLLFYSPPDGRTKIALVSKDRTHLISIWEDDYFLPGGLRVNWLQRYQARNMLQSYLLKKIKLGREKDLESQRSFTARIEVILDNKTEYSEEIQEFALNRSKSLQGPIIAHLKPRLEAITKVVGNNKQIYDGKELRYELWVLDSKTLKRAWYMRVKHEILLKLIEATH